MEDEECIKIYKECINDIMMSDKSGNYELFGYAFNGIFIDLYINYDIEKDDDEMYSFCMYAYCNSEKKNLLLFTQIFIADSVESNINEILRFLMYEFRQNFIYSKMLDEIIRIELQESFEKRKMARIKLVDNGILEKCCVCYEYNNIYTICKHNLCRVCMVSISSNSISENVICPMCRSEI